MCMFGQGVQSWLEHAGQTPPAWQGDKTPRSASSAGKENAGSNVSASQSPRGVDSGKRRRLVVDDDASSMRGAASSKGKTRRRPLTRSQLVAPYAAYGACAGSVREELVHAALCLGRGRCGVRVGAWERHGLVLAQQDMATNGCVLVVSCVCMLAAVKAAADA